MSQIVRVFMPKEENFKLILYLYLLRIRFRFLNRVHMIQIKTPCDANWQEMTPAESGKYCGACEKVVVDFSKMNDVQIKQYFTQYATQKTCGRFLSYQV